MCLSRLLYNQAKRCESDNRLDGKTVIITGASAGIGKETAIDLAQRGGRVILACRNVQKAQVVADEIINTTGNEQVIVRELELSSLASVRKFAKQILDTEEALHVLINNAGISGHTGKTFTEDGLELTMATNHYGHFLLTNMLAGLLVKSSPSRIVNVSSSGHTFVRTLDLDNLSYDKGNFPRAMTRYAHSKLANILFTRELALKLQDTGVTANVLHPGYVYTEFLDKDQTCFRRFFKSCTSWAAKDGNLGAQTSIYLAVDDEVKDVSGEYFSDCKITKTSDAAKDAQLAEKFWEASAQLVNLKPEESYISSIKTLKQPRIAF